MSEQAPAKLTTDLMRELLFQVIDPDRLRGIIEHLATKAEEGHLPSVRLIFTYLIGKPCPAPREVPEPEENPSPQTEAPVSGLSANFTRKLQADLPAYPPQVQTLFPEARDLPNLIRRMCVSGHDVRRKTPRKEPPRAEPPSRKGSPAGQPPPKSSLPSPAAHLSQVEARRGG